MADVSDTSDPGPSPKYQLSPRERELHDALEEIDPELAGLYRIVLPLLNEEGHGVAHVIGYIGRELSNTVARALCRDRPGPVDGSVPKDETHRLRFAEALSLDLMDPRVTRWFKAHAMLHAATHARNPGAAPPNPATVKEAFRLLEALLHARVGLFFRSLEDIDDMLALGEPTARDVEILQGLLLKPAQVMHFYRHLENPAWLPLLHEAGLLAKAPGREVLEDGSWRGAPWPEGMYLLKVAAAAPELVSEILLEMSPDHGNPVVWRGILDIAAALSVEHSVALVPLIITAIDEGFAFFVAPILLAEVVRLARAGHDEAYRIVRRLMHVPEDLADRLSEWDARADQIFPFLPHVIDRDLPDTLEELAEVDGWKTVAMLVGRWRRVAQLVGDQRVVGDERSRGNEDLVEIFLFTAKLLGRLAIQSEADAKRAIALLGDGDNDLVGRLRLRLLADAGEHLVTELDAFLTSDLAMDEDYEVGREVALVLRQAFRFASPAARTSFASRLAVGPPEEARARWRTREDSEERILELVEHWQRRRLRWFRGSVPEELKPLALHLGLEEAPSFEEQEIAEVGSYVTVGSGGYDPTPASATDLAVMPLEQLRELLRTWEPDPSSFESGTSLGLFEALRAMAADNPERGLEVWDLLEHPPDPVHAEALLAGLEDAHRAGKTLEDQDRLVRVLKWAVGSESTAGADGRYPCVRRAVDTVRELCHQNIAARGVADDLAAVMTLAVHHPSVWAERDSFEWDTVDKVESAALNHVAGRVVHALMEFGLWTYRGLGEDRRDIEPQLGPMLDVVLRQGEGQARVAAEAALGAFIPYLSLIAPSWLAANQGALLDGGATDPLGRPTWGQYLIRAMLYDTVFEKLRSWYAVGAAEMKGHAPWSGGRLSIGEHLAEHVIVAYLRGLVSIDDEDAIVANTFTNTAAEDRKHVYWSIFRGWSDRDEAPSNEVIDRLGAFWAWRLSDLEGRGAENGDAAAEAAGFAWFLRTPHIPGHVLVSLGSRSVEVSRGELAIEFEWERIAPLAEGDPNGTLELIEPVLRRQLGGEIWKIRADEVMPVLRTIIDTGGKETRRRAIRLANTLGEAGFADFRELGGG
ncbi:MAG: hypothetical protein ABL963_13890 [Longimicrobiales bacterium]